MSKPTCKLLPWLNTYEMELLIQIYRAGVNGVMLDLEVWYMRTKTIDDRNVIQEAWHKPNPGEKVALTRRSIIRSLVHHKLIECHPGTESIYRVTERGDGYFKPGPQ